VSARRGGFGGRKRGRHELERLLSKAGHCSRLQARALIAAGRVSVNGVVILDPLAWFDARDAIVVDGKALAGLARGRADTGAKAGSGGVARRVLALHKPRGYVTTRSDPEGRPTVYDLVEGCGAWVVPVGRLDLDTSGLLLLTNDTVLADRVTSPASHVPKTYAVVARPALTEEGLAALARGLVLHDGPTRPAVVEIVAQGRTATRFSITITEGRNRQVRRMVKAAGSRVERLERRAIGPIELGGLARGAWRDLEPRELAELEAAIGRGAPVVGKRPRGR
jgi:pseudouridine synthase